MSVETSSPNRPVGVMQLVDTLALGGLERVAVNLANLIPREMYSSHLCTTRSEGPLAELIAVDVGRLRLDRTTRFDFKALKQLSVYSRRHHIGIIHAHGTALFVAILASLLPPYPKVVWHVHYGALAIKTRPVLAYWLLARRVAAVLSVNEDLAVWARNTLGVPADRVHYVRNFVSVGNSATPADDLLGIKGKRIVCVANLRPQKDHVTLVRAMSTVVQEVSDVTLLLVGATTDASQLKKVQDEIARQSLQQNIHILGSRQNVGSILAACDIGVLSSVSEGLPLALIEYGMAGLAAIVTDVGQCAEVVDHGKAGVVVPPGNYHALAETLILLLNDDTLRRDFAKKSHQYLMDNYSAESAMNKVCSVYMDILS